MNKIEMLDRSAQARRAFLKGMGGFVLAVPLLSGVSGAALAMGAKDGEADHADFGLFVSIGTDGRVRVLCHRSEMGQQIRTSLAMIVADELDADWDYVDVVQGQGDPKYGSQNTDGSRSVRRNFHRLRQAGASARHMLITAAAERWGVPVGECSTQGHAVQHAASGKSLNYGALALEASILPVPDPAKLKLKSRNAWRYIGKRMPSIDMVDMLTGRAGYGIDKTLPGMKYAVIERPPVLFGRVKALDAASAKAVRGVEHIVRMPELSPPAGFKALGGVAVVANNSWAAIKGRAALKIEWDGGAHAHVNSADYKAQLQLALDSPGEAVREKGDVDAGLTQAEKRITRDYYVPYLTHAAMEPPMATAHYQDGAVEIWASTQTPQSTRNTVADVLGLPVEKVTVNVTFLGGGFGRKSKPDFSVEAALLSREVGAPVKLMWTREDDIRHSYYHSVSMQRVEAGLDADGKATSWLHRTVFPPIDYTFDHNQSMPHDRAMRQGFIDNPFLVDHMRLERAAANGHIRVGWVRSVCNIFHAFAVQSFAADLAHAAGRDQKDYLLELIGPPRHIDLPAEGAVYDNYGDPIEDYPIDTGRLAAVVRQVAKDSGWDSYKSSPGRALGIAVHRSFLTYVATVVEVEIKDGTLTVPRAWVAIDAGTVVNVEHVTAQAEGGTIYGLSLALGSEITLKDGAVEQSNFHDYLVARMPQMPKTIHVHVMESNAPPAGVGEPATPPALPALTNAIFNATGRRITELPVAEQFSG